MPMKNPPHPGRSVKENCLDHLGLGVTEAAEVLGVCPSYPFAGIERSRGNLAWYGHPPREGRLVQRRLLVEPSDCIRFGSSAQE